jgi:hypothetical protein
MAWDINRWRRGNLPGFLAEWAAREFGAEHAQEIAGIMDQYYQLNFQRKPEHLQWWLPNESPRPSPFTAEETRQRLEAFSQLCGRVDRLNAAMPAAAKDAFYELVAYPVRGTALANERYFFGELSALHAAAGQADAPDLARQAEDAAVRLKEDTRVFNEQIAGGKWRRILALEPADEQWRRFRIAPWAIPRFAPAPKAAEKPTRLPAKVPAGFDGFVETDGVVSIEAAHYTEKVDRSGAGWEVIPRLGRTGDEMAVFPTTAASIEPARLTTEAPRLDYRVYLSTTGEITTIVNLLPTQPILTGNGLRLAVALDDQSPQLVTAGAEVGAPEWAQSVLNEMLTATVRLRVPAAGAHVLKIYMVDAGVVLDKIVIDCGGLKPSYLGPPETRGAK